MTFLKRLRDAWAVLTGKSFAVPFGSKLQNQPMPNADGGPGQPVPPP